VEDLMKEVQGITFTKIQHAYKISDSNIAWLCDDCGHEVKEPYTTGYMCPKCGGTIGVYVRIKE